MAAPLVFITGASSGIGQALAARYAKDGWRLALVARRTNEIEDWVRTQGYDASRYAIYGADVADTGSIVAAGAQCIASQGVPDVVIAKEVTRGTEYKTVGTEKFPASWHIVDVGEQSRGAIEDALAPAKTVFWNGPLGVFEIPSFAHGTNACIVCTSTLELGIDVGDLDLVFQANAPSTVSSFMQRMGRTGRRAGTTDPRR